MEIIQTLNITYLVRNQAISDRNIYSSEINYISALRHLRLNMKLGVCQSILGKGWEEKWLLCLVIRDIWLKFSPSLISQTGYCILLSPQLVSNHISCSLRKHNPGSFSCVISWGEQMLLPKWSIHQGERRPVCQFGRGGGQPAARPHTWSFFFMGSLWGFSGTARHTLPEGRVLAAAVILVRSLLFDCWGPSRWSHNNTSIQGKLTSLCLTPSVEITALAQQTKQQRWEVEGQVSTDKSLHSQTFEYQHYLGLAWYDRLLLISVKSLLHMHIYI